MPLPLFVSTALMPVYRSPAKQLHRQHIHVILGSHRLTMQPCSACTQPTSATTARAPPLLLPSVASLPVVAASAGSVAIAMDTSTGTPSVPVCSPSLWNFLARQARQARLPATARPASSSSAARPPTMLTARMVARGSERGVVPVLAGGACSSRGQPCMAVRSALIRQDHRER
jgi:hypothetical protein